MCVCVCFVCAVSALSSALSGAWLQQPRACESQRRDLFAQLRCLVGIFGRWFFGGRLCCFKRSCCACDLCDHIYRGRFVMMGLLKCHIVFGRSFGLRVELSNLRRWICFQRQTDGQTDQGPETSYARVHSNKKKLNRKLSSSITACYSITKKASARA